VEYLAFSALGVLTCWWVSARPHAKESTTFMSTKHFQRVSTETERLLITRLAMVSCTAYCALFTHYSFLPT